MYWTNSAPYKVSSSFSAALSLMFFGDTATLTVGTGPDHGLFDVYINHSLWRTFDGYASSSAERAIDIPLASMGPHVLEIRHRHAKNLASSGYTLRFKQLLTPNTAFIRYSYDALSRLQEARYNPASDLDAPDADLLRHYVYAYDLAGNRTQEIVHDGVAETKTDYQHNEVNQIWRSRVNEGVWNESYAYDNNGNLTSDGVNAYAWDRANRLFSVNNTAYQYGYDGLGSRVSQTVSGIVTRYLLDVQPGLVNVLAQATGGNTSRFVHGPRGILAYENSLGEWGGVTQDGLGSVRVEMDNNLAVQAAQHYGPYGVPFGIQGAFGLPFGFTGEPTDANALVYLRARYYAPGLGIFPSLDPNEGMLNRPAYFNRYSYVQGRVVNSIDPTGRTSELLDSTCKENQDADICPTTGRPPINGRCRLNYSRSRALSWALGEGRTTTPEYHKIGAGTYCTVFMFYAVTAGGMPLLYDPPFDSGFAENLGLCPPLETENLNCKVNSRDVDKFVNAFLKRGCVWHKCEPQTGIPEDFQPPVMLVLKPNIQQGDLIYQSSTDIGTGHISMFIGWGPEVSSEDLGITLDTPGPGTIPEGISPQPASDDQVMWVVDDRTRPGEPPIPRPFSLEITGMSEYITQILRIPLVFDIDLEYLKASTR